MTEDDYVFCVMNSFAHSSTGTVLPTTQTHNYLQISMTHKQFKIIIMQNKVYKIQLKKNCDHDLL